MAVIQDKKNTGKSFSLKRILINGVVLFGFLISLSYAAVVITNNDITKDGVSFLKQGDTWTTSQNAGNNSLTNLSKVQTLNVSDGLASLSNGILFNAFLNGSVVSRGNKTVVYYAFDETNDSIAYDSTRRYNANLINMNTVGNSTSGWALEDSCVYGRCLRFDGTNDYLTTSIPINTNDTYTFSLWYNAHTTTEALFFSQAAGGFAYGYTGNSFKNWADTDGGASLLTIGVPTETWMHLTWIANLSNGTAIVYKDGILVGTSYAPVSAANNNNMQFIGTYLGSSRFLNGTLDEVHIWNRSLSSQEIYSNYLYGLSTHNPEGHLMPKTGGTFTDSINMSGNYIYGIGVKSFDKVICRTADTGCDVVCTDSDCVTEINDTVSSGNIDVLLRCGNFPISDSITLTSNTIFSGSGNCTVLSMANSADKNVIINKNPLSSPKIDHDITIKDMVLYGNGLQQTTTPDGIYFRNTDNVIINNVRILDTRGYCIGFAVYGSGFISTTNAFITNNICERTTSSLPLADAIAVECENCVISGNTVLNKNGAGITTAQMNNVVISDNDVNVSDAAINLESPSSQTYIIIKDNNLYSTAGLGVTMTTGKSSTTHDISITGNTIDVNSYGLFTNNQDVSTYNVDFSHNIITQRSNAETVLLTNNSNRFKIESNIINVPSANTARIVSLNGTTDISVQDNIVTNGGTLVGLVGLYSNRINIQDNSVKNLRYTFMYPSGVVFLNNSIISGNIIVNTGLAADASYDDGLQLIYVVNSHVSDNLIFDSQDTKTTNIGINVQTGSVNNTIENNHIGTVKGALIANSVTGNYIDDWEYTSIESCVSNNVFQNKIITNSTDYLCKCDSGTWKCLGPMI